MSANPFNEAVYATYRKHSGSAKYPDGMSATDIRAELEGFDLCTVIDVADAMQELYGPPGKHRDA